MSVLNDIFVKYTESDEYENDPVLNQSDETYSRILATVDEDVKGFLVDEFDEYIYTREERSFINGFRTALQLMKELEL